MGLEPGYLDQPKQWDELVGVLRAAGEFGLDTEFSGVELGSESPVGRARVHVWSVAVRSKRMGALGYRPGVGFCLPAAALLHPGLRALLGDPTVEKDVHNQSVDQHALAEHGITLRGAINTLGYVRWRMPWLINQPGRFKLKALMWSLLGRQPVATFAEVMADTRVELRSKWKTRKHTVTHCSCGVEGCRKRKGHAKRAESWEEQEEVVSEHTVKFEWDLPQIVPGHPRWELLVRYAIDDAVAAIEIRELANETVDPAPWPYGGTRPPFSQAVEEAVIAMEAEGFPVDVEWCRTTADGALLDQEAELKWLHRWYVANAPTEGPHRREEVDPIWSSPTQKVRLFDELEFPRSPIWKKGRVKRGEVKMDGAAMEWIATNHKPAAKLIAHLLRLQRVRSGLKYLVKLRDSGGFIHVIAGPAGDEDDRAGAVTGRLGIKGPLEAQQLPKEGEKDLYSVRKAIVANDANAPGC